MAVDPFADPIGSPTQDEANSSGPFPPGGSPAPSPPSVDEASAPAFDGGAAAEDDPIAPRQPAPDDTLKLVQPPAEDPSALGNTSSADDRLPGGDQPSEADQPVALDPRTPRYADGTPLDARAPRFKDGTPVEVEMLQGTHPKHLAQFVSVAPGNYAILVKGLGYARAGNNGLYAFDMRAHMEGRETEPWEGIPFFGWGADIDVDAMLASDGIEEFADDFGEVTVDEVLETAAVGIKEISEAGTVEDLGIGQSKNVDPAHVQLAGDNGAIISPKTRTLTQRSNAQIAQSNSSGSGSGVFARYRGALAKHEGGFVNDPNDRNGPTMKGISQRYLDLLRKQPQWSHLPTQPRNLTDFQIDRIFRKEFFERPQIDMLEQVPGLAKAAPLLPEQVFDAGVHHGIEVAGKWLQQSLDEVLGTDLRTRNPKTGALKYDGIAGSRTRRILEQGIRQGKIKEINNKIVDKRLALMRSLARSKNYPGWIPRAESFRMP